MFENDPKFLPVLSYISEITVMKKYSYESELWFLIIDEETLDYFEIRPNFRTKKIEIFWEIKRDHVS